MTAALTTPQATPAADSARLDWLATMHVEVRVPLVYGSRSLFHASPPDDEDPEQPSDLREQIDAALAALAAASPAPAQQAVTDEMVDRAHVAYRATTTEPIRAALRAVLTAALNTTAQGASDA